MSRWRDQLEQARKRSPRPRGGARPRDPSGRRLVVLQVGVPDFALQPIDGLADVLGLSRSAMVRELVRIGLQTAVFHPEQCFTFEDDEPAN